VLTEHTTPPKNVDLIRADDVNHHFDLLLGAFKATDALTEHVLTLAPLSDATKSRLKAILPPSAALSNPVDVTGGTDANPAIFADCARGRCTIYPAIGTSCAAPKRALQNIAARFPVESTDAKPISGDSEGGEAHLAYVKIGRYRSGIITR
jgi:hypothetical protein